MTDFMAIDEAFLNEVMTLLGSDALEFCAHDRSIEAPVDHSFDIDTRSGNEASSSNDNEQDDEERRISLREKETKRRRVYRQRQKDTREALQHEVDGLTMTLTTMTQDILHRKITNDRGLTENKGDNSCNVDMWKAMATWELASLKRTQGEQKRLLAAISGKAKIIKDLRAVILKRFSKKPATPSQDLTPEVCKQPSDDALFQAYLREVDVNYARINDVFRACGFNTMSEGITDSTVMNPDGSTKEFLHVNKAFHPFKFLSSCDMLWSLSSRHHRQQDREFYIDVKDPDNNTFGVKFRVSKALNTDSACADISKRIALCSSGNFSLRVKGFIMECIRTSQGGVVYDRPPVELVPGWRCMCVVCQCTIASRFSVGQQCINSMMHSKSLQRRITRNFYKVSKELS